MAGHGAVIPRSALTKRDRDEMFALFRTYFANVRRGAFERDLAEKESAVVLRDDRGVIDGFSTLLRFEARGCVVFFSGDTIVARHRRSTPDLCRLWLRHVLELGKDADREVYWFLISSGFRTYRMLPVFFREFHPRFDGRSPRASKPLLDSIASQRYGRAYDPSTGIVRLATPSPLRDAIAGLESRGDRDPHVRFFASANPGHPNGDELACLVRVDPHNLTAAGLRLLR